MRVLIAGGRDFTDTMALINFLVELQNKGIIPETFTVIQGGARGADACGKAVARMAELPMEEFPADWGTHGKSAGYKRNVTMANTSHILVACWDGQSKGTKHMIDIMRKQGKPVHILEY